MTFVTGIAGWPSQSKRYGALRSQSYLAWRFLQMPFVKDTRHSRTEKVPQRTFATRIFFAELSADLSGAICFKTLVLLVVPSTC